MWIDLSRWSNYRENPEHSINFHINGNTIKTITTKEYGGFKIYKLEYIINIKFIDGELIHYKFDNKEIFDEMYNYLKTKLMGDE